MNLSAPFRHLAAMASYLWRVLRIRRDVRTHGTVGAKLREAVRATPAEMVRESRVAFGLKFATYSNRARAAWLEQNGIRVQKIPGLSVRQCQQRAALAWFDYLNGGAKP